MKKESEGKNYLQVILGSLTFNIRSHVKKDKKKNITITGMNRCNRIVVTDCICKSSERNIFHISTSAIKPIPLLKYLYEMKRKIKHEFVLLTISFIVVEFRIPYRQHADRLNE